VARSKATIACLPTCLAIEPTRRALRTRQNSELAEKISRVPTCPAVDGLSVSDLTDRTPSSFERVDSWWECL